MNYSQDPEIEEATSLVVAAKNKLGDYEGAINDFNKSIKLNPRVSKSFFGLGNAKEKLGDQKGPCSD